MSEPLTRELVAECLKTLAVTFPQRGMTPDTEMRRADAYRNALTGVSGDALRKAVLWSTQDDEYFPKPKRLRELASKWTNARYAELAASGEIDPLYCRGCQSRSVPTLRYRPMIDERGRHQFATDGRLMLETFTRLHCACSPKCNWTPDAPDDLHMSIRA